MPTVLAGRNQLPWCIESMMRDSVPMRLGRTKAPRFHRRWTLRMPCWKMGLRGSSNHSLAACASVRGLSVDWPALLEARSKRPCPPEPLYHAPCLSTSTNVEHSPPATAAGDEGPVDSSPVCCLGTSAVDGRSSLAVGSARRTSAVEGRAVSAGVAVMGRTSAVEGRAVSAGVAVMGRTSAVEGRAVSAGVAVPDTLAYRALLLIRLLLLLLLMQR